MKLENLGTMTIEEGDSDDNSLRRSEATHDSFPIAFLFILTFGMSALILGCIQNFGCSTVTFPQVSTAVDGATLGSFNSGVFGYEFVGVDFNNPFEESSTSSDTTTNYDESVNSMEMWEVCRRYGTLGEDMKLAGVETEFSYKGADYMKAAQGMAIIAFALGLVMMLIVCSVPNGGILCVMQWKCYGLFFFLTSVFQGLSLLIFSSSVCLDNPILGVIDDNEKIFGRLGDTFEETCEMGIGAECGIASTVLWFVTAALVCCEKPPGRYKEECLTHMLRAHKQELMARRMKKAAALEEYQQRREQTNNNEQ